MQIFSALVSDKCFDQGPCVPWIYLHVGNYCFKCMTNYEQQPLLVPSRPCLAIEKSAPLPME